MDESRVTAPIAARIVQQEQKLLAPDEVAVNKDTFEQMSTKLAQYDSLIKQTQEQQQKLSMSPEANGKKKSASNTIVGNN